MELLKTISVILSGVQNGSHFDTYIQQIMNFVHQRSLQEQSIDEETIDLISNICTRMYSALTVQEQQTVINDALKVMSGGNSMFKPLEKPSHSQYICIFASLVKGAQQNVCWFCLKNNVIR